MKRAKPDWLQAAAPYLVCLAWQCLSYFLTKFAFSGRCFDLTIALDGAVPFRPAWVLVYYGCYLWWAATPFLVWKFAGETAFYRYAATSLVCYLVCAFVFILVPTSIVRPQVPASGFFSRIVAFLYDADTPYNLFPSMHCAISALCCIPLRRAGAPAWLQIFQAVWAAAVFCSVLFVKQHYVLDIFGGVALAEALYLLPFGRFSAALADAFGRLNERLGLRPRGVFSDVRLETRKRDKKTCVFCRGVVQ